MTTHTVTTQVELDAALATAAADPTGWHDIDVRPPAGVWLELSTVPGSASVSAFGSASVRAYGSASVRAYGSASVHASGSASVRAFGSASVRAYDSASVRASGSASVRAFDSASVRASGSASVRAYDSASVRAYDSASVHASGSASVRASGSASVHAFGSASVHAYGSASVRAFGSARVCGFDSASVSASDSASVHAFGSASVSAYDSASVSAYDSASVHASKYVAVHLHNKRVTVTGGVLIDVTDVDETDVQQWIDYTGADTEGDNVVLYKAVNAALKSERGFPYPVGETVECPDWTDTNDCGGGLHLSPHAHQAHYYYESATRFLRCLVHRDDLRPIPGSVAKAKARRVTVVEEVSA